MIKSSRLETQQFPLRSAWLQGMLGGSAQQLLRFLPQYRWLIYLVEF